MGYSPWGHKESDTTEKFHFLSFMLIDSFSKCSIVSLLYSTHGIRSSGFIGRNHKHQLKKIYGNTVSLQSCVNFYSIAK